MRTTILSALLMAAAARADVPHGDGSDGKTVDAEAERLAGEWTVVAVTARGVPPACLTGFGPGSTMEFRRGEMLIRESAAAPPDRFRIAFDPSGPRKAVDAAPATRGGAPLRGIRGGTPTFMWICFAAEGCPRPTDLSLGADSDHHWIRFALVRSTP